MDEETRKIVEESMNKAHRIGYLAGAEAMHERAANLAEGGHLYVSEKIRRVPLETEKGKS